jgi:hypothetical protein
MRIGASGRRQERKPTLEEIEQARVSLKNNNYYLINEFLTFELLD